MSNSGTRGQLPLLPLPKGYVPEPVARETLWGMTVQALGIPEHLLFAVSGQNYAMANLQTGVVTTGKLPYVETQTRVEGNEYVVTTALYLPKP